MQVFGFLAYTVLTGFGETPLDAALAWPFIACSILATRPFKAGSPLARCNLPHVKCARWQAKQALLAFFRRGLDGSLGSYFFFASMLEPSLTGVSCSSSTSDIWSEREALLSSASWGIVKDLCCLDIVPLCPSQARHKSTNTVECRLLYRVDSTRSIRPVSEHAPAPWHAS